MDGQVSYPELSKEFAVYFCFGRKLPIYSDLEANKYYNVLHSFFSLYFPVLLLPHLHPKMDLPEDDQNIPDQALLISTKGFLSHQFPQSRKNLREFLGALLIQIQSMALKNGLCSHQCGHDPEQRREKTQLSEPEKSRACSFQFIQLCIFSHYILDTHLSTHCHVAFISETCCGIIEILASYANATKISKFYVFPEDNTSYVKQIPGIE